MREELRRSIDNYVERPRKKFMGASSREPRFQQYGEEFARRIEEVAKENYPAEARNRPTSLRLTVAIRPDGSVESTEIDRSSGDPAIDRAALRIVRLASPFPSFTEEIRRDTDLLVITRTWFFGLAAR